MARPVDLACFSARYLALLRRFPNQLLSNSSLVMPAPEANGVVVFAASHNQHYLMFHDPDGFSNGIYEFGLPEEFFEAVGPRHMSPDAEEGGLRFAISNGEYRLYRQTDNDNIFDAAADADVLFTWSGNIGRAQDELCAAFDSVLHLHQSGNAVAIEQTLSSGYCSEIDFIRGQLKSQDPVMMGHRWIRLPDDSVRCLTQFTAGQGDTSHVEAVLCVDADMALG